MNIVGFGMGTYALKNKQIQFGQALSQHAATAMVKPADVFQNTSVQFGSGIQSPSAEEFLADPVMVSLLKRAGTLASRGNSTQIDLGHLLLSVLDHAGQFKSYPDLLQRQAANPKEQVFKQALSGIFPAEVRADLDANRTMGLILKARQQLQSSLSIDITSTAEPEASLPLSSELEGLVKAYLLQGSGKKDTAGFFTYVREQGTSTVANALNTLAEEAKALEPVVEKFEKYPSALREKSAQGFARRVKELQDKGVLSERQLEGVKTMLQSMGNGGGGLGGGMGLDGGRPTDRLDWFLYKFAWHKSRSNVTPERTKQVLDQDHAFLEEPKEDIINYVTRLAHLRDRGIQPKRGEIICLVGPPGVGKTSIAHSIARATNRQMAKVALGKVTMPTDLAGHSATFVGAEPGMMMKAMADAGTVNPVIVLDELDKLGHDGMKGDPSSVLLAALDPEQNHEFVDNFMTENLPIDLSQVLFIATANYENQIPAALRDRVRIIRLDGYDMQEKTTIANNYLIPKVRKELALEKEEFQVTEPAIKIMVEEYSMEAGVRQLERLFRKLGDKTIAELRAGNPIGEINETNVRSILGPPEVFKEKSSEEDLVGYVRGLAVAGLGSGMVLPIQAIVKPIKAKEADAAPEIRLDPKYPVGNLRKMMEESAQMAFTWVDYNKEKLGLQFNPGTIYQVAVAPQNTSVEKDGNSAGAAFTTVIASALSGRPIRHDVAMTGTITLLGEVGAIGGVKQKLRGALNDKMNVVFLPMDNFRLDVPRLPKRMLDELNILTMAEFKEKQKTGEHIVPGKMTVVGASRVEDILDYTLLPKAEAQDTALQPSITTVGPRFGARHLSVVKPLLDRVG